MLAPELVNEFGQTYEEMRAEVDMEIYGIADDPSVPYPWDRSLEQVFAQEKPQETVEEIVLIAA